jgi:heme/copper-type cytochrome/quinol oxidase subunit 1
VRADAIHEASVSGSRSAAEMLLPRLHLGGTALALVLGGAAALAMRALLWTAHASDSPHRYATLFELHASVMFGGIGLSALSCGVATSVVPEAMGASSPRTAWLAIIGWAAWVAALALSMGLLGPAQPIVALGAATVALGSTAIHLGSVCAAGVRRPMGWGAVAALAATAATAFLAVECGRQLFAQVSQAGPGLTFYRWQPTFTEVRVNAPNVALAAALGLHLVTRRPNVADRSERRSLVPALYFICGVIPAALLLAATSSLLGLMGPDIHLHDTYFETGAIHAGASVVLLATLAGVHASFAELVGRTYAEGLARAGAIVTAAGTLATSIGMLLLGTRGMPRRYATYLEDFEPLQQVIGVSAAAVAVGLALVVASMMAGRRLPPPQLSDSRA